MSGERGGIEGPNPAMELYLSACSKAANVASTKTATSGLSSDSQQCRDVSVRVPAIVVTFSGAFGLVGGAGRGQPLTSRKIRKVSNRPASGSLVWCGRWQGSGHQLAVAQPVTVEGLDT